MRAERDPLGGIDELIEQDDFEDDDEDIEAEIAAIDAELRGDDDGAVDEPRTRKRRRLAAATPTVLTSPRRRSKTKTSNTPPRPRPTPDLVVARVLKNVFERISSDEAARWADRLGILSQVRALGELPSSIALFYLEADRKQPGALVRVPSRASIAHELYDRIADIPTASQIRQRRRRAISIDGELMPAAVSEFEYEYSARCDRVLERPLPADTQWENLVKEDELLLDELHDEIVAETNRVIAIRRIREPTLDPFAPRPPRPTEDFGEILDPGVMASFFALRGVDVPWDRADRPWERQPSGDLDIRAFRQAVDRPGRVREDEIDNFGFLGPIRRFRVRMLESSIPTGMRLAVDSFFAGRPLASKLSVDAPEVVDHLRILHAEDSAPATALLEIAQLCGVRNVRDEHFVPVFRLVQEAFGFPLDLPQPPFGGKIVRDDQPITWHEVTAIQSWTDVPKVRWALRDCMVRIKSSRDPFDRIRWCSAWVTEVNEQKLPRVNGKNFFGKGMAKEILDAFVWKQVAGHVPGRAATVYQVSYQFGSGPTVDEQMLVELWGRPRQF